MRIISQDGTVDVPYEEVAIVVNPDNELIACGVNCLELENSASKPYWILKEESNRKRALAEMQSIRQSFLDGMIYHHIGGKENAS